MSAALDDAGRGPLTRQFAAADTLTLPRYRADIDGLRAIAVLSVIGFHTFPDWFKGGFTGVDVFFVISGYLISTIVFASLDKGSFSFVEFYARRVRRIFPALILVLVVTCAVGWAELLDDELKQLGKHVAGSAGFIQNFVLASEAGYFDQAAETKPLLHIWSLGIEEQFYIVWPLVLFLAWKRRAVLFAVILVLLAASFLLNAAVRSDAAGDFFSPITRSWELLIGGLLAYLALSKSASARGRVAAAVNTAGFRHLASGVGLALIAVAVLALNGERFFQGGWMLVPAAGAFMLIAAGPSAWCNRLVLSNRVLVGVGLISYPLYLWHWPLLSFARIGNGAPLSVSMRLALVATSFALAWATYRFVERPIRFGAKGNAKALALVAAMLLVGVAGYDVYRREGLPQRFPDTIQTISKARYDMAGGSARTPCFLQINQDESAFGNCVEAPPRPAAPSIVLWGDSYAAHLYPGLRREFGDRFALTQLTAAGCPPILGFDEVPERHCKSVNSYIRDRVIRERPDRIVLAANWSAYGNWSEIEKTIAELRAAGAKRIDLVGPLPEWRYGLRRSLLGFYRQDRVLHRVPQRMTYGLVPGMESLDRTMEALAARLGVEYVSALRILCNDDGCLTRTSDDVRSLTAMGSHLTDAGSLYLVSHFPR